MTMLRSFQFRPTARDDDDVDANVINPEEIRHSEEEEEEEEETKSQARQTATPRRRCPSRTTVWGHHRGSSVCFTSNPPGFDMDMVVADGLTSADTARQLACFETKEGGVSTGYTTGIQSGPRRRRRR